MGRKGCARMASASATQGGRGSTAPPSPATLDASSTAPALRGTVNAARVGGASTAPSTTVQTPALGRGSASEILSTVGDASVRPDGEAQAILLPRTALSPKSLFVGTVKTTIKVGPIKLMFLIIRRSDGLVDCEDPECCWSEACGGSQYCSTVPNPVSVLQKTSVVVSPFASFFERYKFLVLPGSLQKFAKLKDFDPG